MSPLFLIFLLVFLFIMVHKNRILMKRMKKVKKYTACSKAIFDHDEKALDVINDYLEQEDSLEFQNKARILKAIVEVDHDIDPTTTLNLFDLKEIILKDGKSFDKNKTNFNSDTFVWLLALMIKAKTHANQACLDLVYNSVMNYANYLENDLATRMIKILYQIFNGNMVEDNVEILRGFYKGNYVGLTYDKNVIGIYKYLSIAIVRYVNATVSEEEGNDIVEFSKMKVGRIMLEDLGLLEEYNALKSLDKKEPVLEEPTANQEETVEPVLEEQTAEPVIETTNTEEEEN